MKVLAVHNSYLQPGGEDVVFEQETELLEKHGHKVVRFHCRNEIVDGSIRQKFTIARSALWASASARTLRAVIVKERPDIAHFHNVFSAISPSCYYACRELNVPVVQTAHNYRVMCPSSDLFRDGHTCEACVGKRVAWPGVLHGCYHASRLQTGVVATMIAAHHWWSTWLNQIDTYIAPSVCVRGKLIDSGIPAEKIAVKPNFINPDPGYQQVRGSRYAIFAGRISREKGVTLLVEAWRGISKLPLVIVGDGPETSRVRSLVEHGRVSNVEMLGFKPRSELSQLIKQAVLLVFPSQWQEVFGLTVVEAFACGVPVIATRIGALPELIDEGRTGLMFSPGSPEELAEKVRWAIGHPAEMEKIRSAARVEYERRFSASANYPQLYRVYEQTIERFAATRRRVTNSTALASEDRATL